MFTFYAMKLAYTTDFSLGASMGQLGQAHLEMVVAHTVMGCEQTRWQLGKPPLHVTRQREEGNTKGSSTWEELRNKFLILQQPEMSFPSQAGACRRREPALGWANTDAGAEWEHSQPKLFLTGAKEAFTFHYEGKTKCPSVVLNLFTGRVGVEACKAPGPCLWDQQL